VGCPLGQRLSLPQLATGLTAVWGMGFTLDALVRVLLAYAIPIDSVPLVSTVQWLVVLGGLVTFHIAYITKHGLKA
jgi:hypothetical protein